MILSELVAKANDFFFFNERALGYYEIEAISDLIGLDGIGTTGYQRAIDSLVELKKRRFESEDAEPVYVRLSEYVIEPHEFVQDIEAGFLESIIICWICNYTTSADLDNCIGWLYAVSTKIFGLQPPEVVKK